MRAGELHRQKYQTRLDEWKAEVARLKARAAGVKADAQIELSQHMKEREQRLHEAGARLSELAAASEEKWDPARRNAESTWDALKASLRAARAKLKE